MIVPFGAGGSTDIVGRIAAEAMSKSLGVSVIVENKGGAGGTVGTQAAANAAPDGYTVTMSTTSTHVVGPLTVQTVKYDPVKDFEPIGMIAETPYVLVISPKLAVNSVKELIDYAKKNPGKLNFGSAGEGSTTHLAGAHVPGRDRHEDGARPVQEQRRLDQGGADRRGAGALRLHARGARPDQGRQPSGPWRSGPRPARRSCPTCDDAGRRRARATARRCGWAFRRPPRRPPAW